MTPRPGDFIVFQSTGWAARAIQFGTRSRWNHAAIYIGGGVVIEAQPSGVTSTPLSEWHREDYIVSDLPLSSWQRTKVVKYAHDQVGIGYGWLDIVALALLSLGLGKPGGWVEERAKRDDRLVCSQLVSDAYAYAGFPLAPDPWAVTPGDLETYIVTHDDH